MQETHSDLDGQIKRSNPCRYEYLSYLLLARQQHIGRYGLLANDDVTFSIHVYQGTSCI